VKLFTVDLDRPDFLDRVRNGLEEHGTLDRLFGEWLVDAHPELLPAIAEVKAAAVRPQRRGSRSRFDWDCQTRRVDEYRKRPVVCDACGRRMVRSSLSHHRLRWCPAGN